MLNDIATWIFNVMVLGALVTLAVLLYETINPGFLANQAGLFSAFIAVGAVALLSLVWPKY